MLPSPKLLFITTNNNPTNVGLALGSTIHFDSLEFIANRFGHLSFSLERWDSGAMFVGMVHSGSPSQRTPLEESSNENGSTSGAGGSLGSPAPRGCNVVTSTDPTIAALVPESTLVLQTSLTVTVRMTAPQPGMESLLDQQQAYQEEQQARAHARQINAKQWAAQHHDELAGEQAALDAEMTELHQCKPALGTERGTAIDYTKA
jgi:hypothetical protein